jgi:predicted PurR-regulated permease PerM
MASQSKRLLQPMSGINFSVGFMVLCIVVYVLHMAAHIIVPLVISIIIWYLINAAARWLMSLEEHGIPLPRTLCYALAIALLLLGLYGIYELIRQNAAHISQAAPAYQARFEEIRPQVMSLLGLDHIPTAPEIVKQINIGDIIKTMVGVFAGMAVTIIEIIFLTAFLLYEQRFFKNKIANMSSDKSVESNVRNILHNIDVKIQRYIGVKTLVSTLAGIATYIILRCFGVNFAAFWGLMAFFLHFIPYVGTFGAIALPAIMTLIQFDVTTFGWVAAFLSGSLMAIGHGLDPRLLGDRLNLSPICIILSLAVWGEIWGVPGAFLAIPLLTIMVIIMSQFDATRPFAVLLSKTGVIDKGEKAE